MESKSRGKPSNRGRAVQVGSTPFVSTGSAMHSRRRAFDSNGQVVHCALGCPARSIVELGVSASPRQPQGQPAAASPAGSALGQEGEEAEEGRGLLALPEPRAFNMLTPRSPSPSNRAWPSRRGKWGVIAIRKLPLFAPGRAGAQLRSPLLRAAHWRRGTRRHAR